MLQLSRCVRSLSGWDYGLDWLRVPHSQGMVAIVALKEDLQSWATAIDRPVTVRWGNRKFVVKPIKESPIMQEFAPIAANPKIYARAMALDPDVLRVLDTLSGIETPAGISTFTHKQIAVNSATLALFPDSPENLIDLDVAALWFPADLEEFDRAVQQGLGSDGDWFEFTIRTRLSSNPSQWLQLINRYRFPSENLQIRLGLNLEAKIIEVPALA